jgi:hypothetical protein
MGLGLQFTREYLAREWKLSDLPSEKQVKERVEAGKTGWRGLQYFDAFAGLYFIVTLLVTLFRI